jgi:hypothetical protein
MRGITARLALLLKNQLSTAAAMPHTRLAKNHFQCAIHCAWANHIRRNDIVRIYAPTCCYPPTHALAARFLPGDGSKRSLKNTSRNPALIHHRSGVAGQCFCRKKPQLLRHPLYVTDFNSRYSVQRWQKSSGPGRQAGTLNKKLFVVASFQQSQRSSHPAPEFRNLVNWIQQWITNSFFSSASASSWCCS